MGCAISTAGTRSATTKNKVELCFTPAYASWANPIEAHFGPLRQFTIANSQHPKHTVQTRALHAYLRWRNANPRRPRRPGRRAQGTRPHRQREGHPLGRAPPRHRGLSDPANLWSEH